MTDWGAFSAADFDRSRARKGTRARSADPGLFHVATPVERPAKTKPAPEPLPGEVALFGDDTESPQQAPGRLPAGERSQERSRNQQATSHVTESENQP